MHCTAQIRISTPYLNNAGVVLGRRLNLLSFDVAHSWVAYETTDRAKKTNKGNAISGALLRWSL